MRADLNLDELVVSVVGEPTVSPNSPNSPAARVGETVASLPTVLAADVTPRKLSYLWSPRIPLGELTIGVGRGGLGKTVLLAAEIPARVTRGELDGDLDGPANVLIASGEDAIDHTLVPRLYAAGADLDRVRFLTDLLTLPDDVERLAAAVAEHDAKLVIIDPLAAALGAGVDSHRDASIRRALSPLANLAHESGAAVVAIAHLNKSPTGDLYLAVSGSAGLFNAARSVLVVAGDPDTEAADNARVLMHGKSNTAELAPAVRFAVVGTDVEAGELTLNVPRAELGDEVPGLSVHDVLDQGTAEDRSASSEAEEWLREALANGPRHARNIKADAQRAGYPPRTLERAAGSLDRRGELRRRRDGFQGPVTWELVTHSPPNSPNPNAGEYGEYGESESPT
jgi:hypothetical protein